MEQEEHLCGHCEERRITFCHSSEFSTCCGIAWKDAKDHRIFRSPSHSLSYLLGKWTFNFFVGFKVRRAERKVLTLFYKSLDLVLLLVLSFLCTEVVTLFQVWLRNKDSTCGNL
jgi:hypothetical protein